MKEIILGTANFMRGYGHAKKSLDIDEIRKILDKAEEIGLTIADTSPNYFGVHSKLAQMNRGRFEFITKFIDDQKHRNPCQSLQDAVDKSLSELKIDRLHGLIFHRSSDLKGSRGQDLIDAALNLKSTSKISKLGVSIYEPDEVLNLDSILHFQIVQGPLNVLDQRLITSGILELLANKNLEFHARSVFLQGTLLNPQNDRPSPFHDWETSWLSYHSSVQQNKLTAMEACLGFVESNPLVGKILIGVDSAEQLAAIDLAKNKALPLKSAFSPVDEPLLIDPRNWT